MYICQSTLNINLTNKQVTRPILSLYLINTYRNPSRLFITGGQETTSSEGVTQDDPLAMPWYSLNTVTIIQNLRTLDPDVKQVWLADDAAAGGTIELLNKWYDHLVLEGKKYGYYVNGANSWLIKKTPEISENAKLLLGDKVNITMEGKRHLGAVIGSKAYKDQYCEKKVSKWVQELTSLSDIAKTQPQAAFIAFNNGYKSKFTYFQRTIEGFEDYLEPVHEILNESFLPAIFGRDVPFPEPYLQLFTLPPSDGDLGIPALSDESKRQFKGSTLITAPHVKAIIEQKMTLTPESLMIFEDLKKHNSTTKTKLHKEDIVKIDSIIPPELTPLVKQARDSGAISWLNALPLEQQGFNLNKDEFRDAVNLRYNLPLNGLPSRCTCGKPFDVKHAMSCKKGGFVSQRHDNIRDLFTILLDKVCKNVQSEPHLLPLEGESFDLLTANKSEEARLDIKANGFWRPGQTAFFDVRETHVNSTTNINHDTEKIFQLNEAEKKRQYLQRVLEVEHASFTPLVLGTNGGMGKECRLFVKTLAEKLAKKQNESYSTIISWLRTKLSFCVLRSVILCVRGSRTPWLVKNDFEVGEDFRLNNAEAGLF